MSDIIATDAHNSSIDSGIVELFEIEVLGTTYYLLSEFNTENAGTIIFDGNTYEPFPLMIDGIEIASDGAQNRPKLSMANVVSLLSTDILGSTFDFEDFIGGRVTVRTTLEKYTGVGVTAHEFPKKVFVIDRISAKNSLVIELELASPFDLQNIRIPSRVVVGKYCPWTYAHHTIGGDDQKSGCYWRPNYLRDSSDSRYFIFYTKDDEPIIHIDELSTVDTYFKGAYSGVTEYNMGEIVSHGGYYWQCKDYSLTGKAPGSTFGLYWQKVRTYSTWTSVATYNASSTPEDNDYVIHNDMVWRCLRTHSNIEPGTNSLIWVRGDQCGKLLESCKARYQATAHSSSGTGINTRPHYWKDKDVTLPFGGFPGSRKFR
jgi:lambda family phage minor tail protein L